MALRLEQQSSFCIENAYQKETGPEPLFEALSEIVYALRNFDAEIAQAISGHIESRVVLERMATGSIRAWFASQLKDIDDESIRHLNWKDILGGLLVKAKYRLIKLLEKKESLSPEDVAALQNELSELLRKSELKAIASYGAVSQRVIVHSYVRTARAVGQLGADDNVKFICQYGEALIGHHAHISDAMIEELLVSKREVSECDICLKVKKPDYLGDSKWVLQLDGRLIDAKLEDQVWLKDFRNRRIPLQPGDSLKARLRTELRFDKEGV